MPRFDDDVEGWKTPAFIAENAQNCRIVGWGSLERFR
jgi:hypothetical protein